MLELQYGIIDHVDDADAYVTLSGYDRDVVVCARLLQLGGASSVKTWISPQRGDCVAVVVDTERPECSIVLGGVYAGSSKPVASGSKAAIQASEVRLGDDISAAKKAPRDDHVQSELNAIKAALDSLVGQLNSHTHPCPNGSTSAPTVPMSNEYTVGATAADSVYVK